jgi:hypothetical protein
MAQVYTALQTVTLTSDTSTINFINIPQNYTDLIIRASLRGSTSTTTFAVQVNGSTVTSVRRLFGTGSSISTDTFNEHYIDPSTYTANTFGSTELYFPNYSGSNTKAYFVDSLGENVASEAYINMASNSTGSTSAITSISLIRTNGNFVANSTATIYGVGGARAAGGTITADSQYTYHTFTSSSVFTPLENITGGQILIIAGGGGGGARGGGGGAGGVVIASNQAFPAGATYSTIIGAGGNGATTSADGTNGSNSLFTSFTAIGGGRGGSVNSTRAGASGGSGGGTSSGSSSGGSGTQTASGANFIGYGASGGFNTAGGGQDTGAGGGGAGGTGLNGTTTVAGFGGSGVLLADWSRATNTGASNGYYAGGGGGGGNSVSGAGGYGGGGNGGQGADNATAGSANTGGGGGGGGNLYAGKTGGSGLIIIRYPN